jgi:hypothetical protein
MQAIKGYPPHPFQFFIRAIRFSSVQSAVAYATGGESSPDPERKQT